MILSECFLSVFCAGRREKKIFTLADIFLIIIITKFLIPNSTVFRALLYVYTIAGLQWRQSDFKSPERKNF